MMEKLKMMFVLKIFRICLTGFLTGLVQENPIYNINWLIIQVKGMRLCGVDYLKAINKGLSPGLKKSVATNLMAGEQGSLYVLVPDFVDEKE